VQTQEPPKIRAVARLGWLPNCNAVTRTPGEPRTHRRRAWQLAKRSTYPRHRPVAPEFRGCCRSGEIEHLMPGSPESACRLRPNPGAAVVLFAVLLFFGGGLAGPGVVATPTADIEVTDDAAPIVVDDKRGRRGVTVRVARRIVSWRSRLVGRAPRPALPAAPRSLPRFRRRGSPPRRGPPGRE